MAGGRQKSAGLPQSGRKAAVARVQTCVEVGKKIERLCPEVPESWGVSLLQGVESEASDHNGGGG